MSKPNIASRTAKDGEDQDAAQAARPHALRSPIDQTESSAVRSPHESAHDFVERRMRESFKK